MKVLGIKEWVAVAAALFIVLYFFVFSSTGLIPLIGKRSETAPSTALVPQNQETPATTTSLTTHNQATPMDTPGTHSLPGIIITDEVIGTGAEATTGKTVTVNYTGMFADGKVFDSSIPRGEPFVFNLGGGQVIKGWDEGVVGMKVGGKRKLVISPEKAYGPNDYGPIPGNSTLTFEVELLGVN